MKGPEYFEKKLYIPRNAEGKPNVEAIKQIREIEAKLEEHPAFFGLAPVGSIMGGYSTEKSDIDFDILYDAKAGNDAIKAHEEIIKIATELRGELRKQGKRDMGISLTNINPDAVWETYRSDPRVTHYLVSALARMSEVVTGRKIQQYRQIYAEELHKLPLDKQMMLIDKVATFLADQEVLSTQKRKRRVLPGKSEEEIHKMRRVLWKARVENMWLHGY